KVIKGLRIFVGAFALGFGAPHAEEQRPGQATWKVGEEATALASMNVTDLRQEFCGGEYTQGNQDAKNAKFIGCVMYVLGVVDMLREWQKIDPVHAPSVCVPRAATAGGLILVVQNHIAAETSTRWGGLEMDVPSPGTLSRCSDRAPQWTRRDR